VDERLADQNVLSCGGLTAGATRLALLLSIATLTLRFVKGKENPMNGPHKFGTEFGSDNAPEHSAAIVSHHDSIKWFEAIPGEQLCIRVHGTQVNGRYAIMENIAAPSD
jgi:hypothetical protein